MKGKWVNTLIVNVYGESKREAEEISDMIKRLLDITNIEVLDEN